MVCKVQKCNSWKCKYTQSCMYVHSTVLMEYVNTKLLQLYTHRVATSGLGDDVKAGCTLGRTPSAIYNSR